MCDAYRPSTIAPKTATRCRQSGPGGGTVLQSEPVAAPECPAIDDDMVLVDAWRNDADDAAFEALVARYQRFVFRIALSVLGAGGREEAEDVTQEVRWRISHST